MITAVTRPLPGGARPGSAGPPGGLAVAPGSLSLGGAVTGQVCVTAVGGPVRWTAATSAARVTLSSYSGTLLPGQSTTLVVSVGRAGSGGLAVVTITTGAAARVIGVSWTTRSAHGWHGPSPSPSPAQSGPSASPTPSASPS
jgi:hypothetical protein